MTRWVVAGLLAAGLLLVSLPVLMLASLTGMDAASAMSACLAGLPATSTTVNRAGLTAEQVQNAATIIGVGQSLVGERGETIAIAVALVESGLVNVDHGTGSSLGLFQQIASWGTARQRMDPVWSSTAFYRHLLAVPGWASMPPGVAAQAVQQSAFPDRYAAKVPEAAAIVGSAAPGPVLAAGLCPDTPLPGGLPASVAQAVSQAPQPVRLAVEYAMAQLGKPYQWGATGPNAFDCSGLMMMSWRAAGISLPRTTFAQLADPALTDVTAGPLQPGDLVYPEAGHVGMAVGGGWWVEAPHTGDVVKLGPMPTVWAARRVVQ